MKTSKAYHHNGLFRYLEGDGWPVKPVTPYGTTSDTALYNKAVLEYNRYIQLALDKSIPYEDQSLINAICWKYNGDGNLTQKLQEGLYDIPEIEVVIGPPEHLPNGFKVARIVPQSSEPSGNPDLIEKPDFEKMAEESVQWYLEEDEDTDYSLAFTNGCEKIWNDFVVPRDAKISELEEWKRQQLKITTPLFDWGQSRKDIPLGSSITKAILDRLSEFDRLKSELDKAKNEAIESCILTLASKFPEFGNKEFSIRDIRRELDFLKDKP